MLYHLSYYREVGVCLSAEGRFGCGGSVRVKCKGNKTLSSGVSLKIFFKSRVNLLTQRDLEKIRIEINFAG